MKTMRVLTPLAIAVSAMVGSHQALAGPSGYAPPAPSGPEPVYSAGTGVVRIGASFVDPDDDRGRFDLRDPLFTDDVLGDDFRRPRYRLDDDTTWNFTAGFMPMDHFMIEVGYIGQSDHDLDLRAPVVEVIDAGDTLVVVEDNQDLRLGKLERRSGFAMANWFPVCTESWVQPYIGIGAHYTDFDNHNIRTPVADVLVDFAGASEPFDGRVRYDDDWGWAGQIGVDIMFGRDSNWMANAAVMYLDTEVKADLHYRVDNDNFRSGTAVRALRTDFDFDPWVYNLGIGYRF